MKKMITITGILTGFIIVGFISYQFGYYKNYYSTHEASCNEWQKGIEARTETYQPSCEQLTEKGIPAIIKKENDYFFVHSSKNYFYVFGINIAPGKPPQIHWWGADTGELLNNCSENNN